MVFFKGKRVVNPNEWIVGPNHPVINMVHNYIYIYIGGLIFFFKLTNFLSNLKTILRRLMNWYHLNQGVIMSQLLTES